MNSIRLYFSESWKKFTTYTTITDGIIPSAYFVKPLDEKS